MYEGKLVFFFFSQPYDKQPTCFALKEISVANFKAAPMLRYMSRFQLSDGLLFALVHLSASATSWREYSAPGEYNLFLFISKPEGLWGEGGIRRAFMHLMQGQRRADDSSS